MKSHLQGKNILLGVTGGIAAYKSVELVRLLVKAGAEVRVVMTDAAARFVAPLSLQAVSGAAVRTDLFDREQEAVMGHIDLARWADELVVAPASADFIARLAAGMANDLLSAICLAANCPLTLVPAMNSAMWLNLATQDNVSRLIARGSRILGPAEGELACGETGPGRMLEPQLIIDAMQPTGMLFAGSKVLLTAGPTREALDPVRYLSNRSSGRMGYALAQAFAEQGADVTLISGPTGLAVPGGVHSLFVESAQQMAEAVRAHLPGVDVFAGVAAVADFRPENLAVQKIKKVETGEPVTIRLVKNPDILAEVAAMTENRPFVLGFAAETEKLLQHAREKMQRKNLDMIAANLVGDGLGFESEQNQLHLVWPGGERLLPRAGKLVLARALVCVLAERVQSLKGEDVHNV